MHHVLVLILVLPSSALVFTALVKNLVILAITLFYQFVVFREVCRSVWLIIELSI